MRHFILVGLLAVGVLALGACGSETSINVGADEEPGQMPDPDPDPDPDPGPNDQPLAGDQQVLNLIANQTDEVSDPIEISALGLVFNENPDANVYGDLLPES